MKILHFSDIHFRLHRSDVSFKDIVVVERLMKTLSYVIRQSKFENSREKFGKFQNFALSQKPDLIVFSGDFTSLGRLSEHERAKHHLSEILNSNIPFVFVPGNHDLYKKRDSDQVPFYPVWRDLILSSSKSLLQDALWPRIAEYEDATVLLVNSSVEGNQPWDTTGRIAKQELEAVDKVIQEHNVKKKVLLIVTHYGIENADSQEDKHFHRLVNANEFRSVISNGQKVLLLHGHIHRAFVNDIVKGQVYSICAGSLISSGDEAFWEIDVSQNRFMFRRGHYFDGKYFLENDKTICDWADCTPKLPAFEEGPTSGSSGN